MAVKPTNLAEWGTGAAPIVEPTTPQKQAGWPVDFKPPAQWFNWWMKLVHQWMVWLDAFESDPHTWSGFQTFSQFENTTTAIFNGSTSFNGSVALGAGASASIERQLNFYAGLVSTDPMLTRSQIATTPHLIYQQDATVGGMVLRLYAQADRGLIATLNARWDNGASNWVKDVVDISWMMSLGNAIRHYQHQPTTSPFADSAWLELFTTVCGLGSGFVWAGRSAGDGVAVATRHVPQLAWTNLTLSANLTAVVGDEPQYYRDTTGRVFMRGAATANTTIVSGTQVASLPVAIPYPDRPMTFPLAIVDLAIKYQLVFQTSGRVDMQCGTPGNVLTGTVFNFANLSYRAG